MKFEIFLDKKKEWRWNAQAGGNILFASGEGFEKPQKMVTSLRKNVVREDVKLEAALVKALKAVGLDVKGSLIKEAKAGPAKPPVAKPVKSAAEPAWPFPTGNTP